MGKYQQIKYSVFFLIFLYVSCFHYNCKAESLAKDTCLNLQDSSIHKFYIPPVKYKPRIKDFVIPAGMIAVGALASQTNDYRDFFNIHRPNGRREITQIDNVLQYVVPSSLYIFDIVGKEKHHPIDQFFIMGCSFGLTALQVRTLKSHLHETRPDGGNYSFPSGHTAVAFIGAQMIYKEFKDSNPYIAYSGYVMASAVGVLRAVNNRHWLSDVVAGAGIAMLSTEFVYLVYFPIRNLITNAANKAFGKEFSFAPEISPNRIGLQVCLNF